MFDYSCTPLIHISDLIVDESLVHIIPNKAVISNFQYINIVSKIIHSNNIITISIEFF